MWYAQPGPDSPAGLPFKADRQGRWDYEFVGDTGYYVTVAKIVKGSGEHRHVCKGDRSPTRSLP